MFHLLFLSVKARTAQLAKIKWFISVAFYILQVSVWCCPGSGQRFIPFFFLLVCVCVCGCMPVFYVVYGGQRWMDVGCLPRVHCSPAYIQRQVLSLNLIQLIQSASQRLLVSMSSEIQTLGCFALNIYVGAGDQSCMASSLPAGPFIQLPAVNF